MKIEAKLFLFVLIFMFLKSLNAWFTWNLSNYILLFQLLLSIPYLIKYWDTIYFKRNLVPIVIYCISIYLLGFKWDLGGIMGFLCNVFPVIILIASSTKFKKYSLEKLTKFFCLFLIPSLILYIFSFIVPLPNFGNISNLSWDQYNYTNYGLFLKGKFYDIRFHSIFLEPGHLGMIISFLLFALRFNVKKWEVWCLLIVEIATLSLAGYLLCGIAYIFSLLVERKSITKLLTYILIVFGSLYYGSTVYNDGNNLVNTLIFSRLEFDEEKGVVGNNRFAQYADNLVEDKILKGEIWYGTSRKLWEGEFLGAGWKVFFIKYGALPILFFFLFYLSFIRNTLDKRFVYLFLAFFVFAFLQRAYTYWFAWNFPFIAGIGARNYEIFNKGKLINDQN